MRSNKDDRSNKYSDPQDHSNNSNDSDDSNDSDNSKEPSFIDACRKALDVLLQPVAILIDFIESIIKLARSKSIERQYGTILYALAGAISGTLPFFIVDRNRLAEGLLVGALLGTMWVLISEESCLYVGLSWPFYFIAIGLIPPTTPTLVIRANYLIRCMTSSTIVGAITCFMAGESRGLDPNSPEANALAIGGLCIGPLVGFATGFAGGRVSLRVARNIVRGVVGALVGVIIGSYIWAAVFAIYVAITRVHSIPVAIIIMVPALASGACLGAWFGLRRWDQLTERAHKLFLGAMVGVHLGSFASPFVLVIFDVDAGLGMITLGVLGAALGIICVYISNMRKYGRNW